MAILRVEDHDRLSREHYQFAKEEMARRQRLLAGVNRIFIILELNNVVLQCHPGEFWNLDQICIPRRELAA